MKEYKIELEIFEGNGGQLRTGGGGISWRFLRFHTIIFLILGR
jgi:hypothetical protein